MKKSNDSLLTSFRLVRNRYISACIEARRFPTSGNDGFFPKPHRLLSFLSHKRRDQKAPEPLVTGFPERRKAEDDRARVFAHSEGPCQPVPDGQEAREIRVGLEPLD